MPDDGTPAAHADLVVLQTPDWTLAHRADAALPGYLILAARTGTDELSRLPPGALAELGRLLADAQRALKAILNPEHLYIARYGHMAGHSFHFHIIPVCAWVKRSFFRDPRYRVLQDLSSGSAADDADGAELTLFIWREFCERPDPPLISGPSIGEVVARLRTLIRGSPEGSLRTQHDE